jgi:hypothetical protein
MGVGRKEPAWSSVSYTRGIRTYEPEPRCSLQPVNGLSRISVPYRVAAMAMSVCLCIFFGVFWTARPILHWADRRPIGALFLASHFHASRSNPRGWFNDPSLDVGGNEGTERFRKAMLACADRSITILKRTGSQGMIVWDLEGEEFPHKITYIGDPRLLPRLAPEAEPIVDEFFGRFRKAGLAVGVAIRPQQMSFDPEGSPRQENGGDYERRLIDKIDYAQRRWGATLFYIDSNGGPLWPAEVFHLRRIARQRPKFLLIPEHVDILYYGFSAPYGTMQHGDKPTGRAIHWFYPDGFQVLAIAESKASDTELATAYRAGDILLFPAWFDNPASRFIENIASHPGHPGPTTTPTIKASRN